MAQDDLSVLPLLLTVAEERSFTRAARRLGVSPSAVSHAVRGLEERLGVRLLSRTTRSVAPTEAGEQLLARLRPAMSEVRTALDQISGLRNKPAGRIRLLAPRLAVSSVFAPKLGQFARDYPQVLLDITTDDSRMDIVAGGFDAGIHFGEYIEKDMIAVRVSPDLRAAIVGSPEYFESHPKPRSPRDLVGHRCINFRHGSAGVYRWEFERGKKSLSVGVSGPLIVDDIELVVRGGAGRRWLGLPGGGSGHAACGKRRASASAGVMVPAVSRVFPVLPEPAAAAGCADGVDQRAAVVAQRAEMDP